MASRLGPLELDKPEAVATWLLAFNAMARTKEWEDDHENSKFEITDNFMSLCGIDAL